MSGCIENAACILAAAILVHGCVANDIRVEVQQSDTMSKAECMGYQAGSGLREFINGDVE